MAVDKIIQDHPQTISTLVNIDQMRYILNNLFAAAQLPGDVVELACNIGTTALYIRRMLNVVAPEKIYHVYDSFEGLPAPMEIDGSSRQKGHMKTDQSVLERNFAEAGLVCPVIHKGWFSEIPDNEYPDKICFAFFDGDFYSSIMDSFFKVYHKMVPGGIIIVHDYEGAMLPGVKVACDDFLRDKPEKVNEVYYGMARIIKE